MTLPASGTISLNQVNVELGFSGTAQIGLNDAAVRGLFGVASGQISMANGYGKSNEYILTSAGLVNGQKQRQQISVSSFISSGDTMRIPSDIWVWSDSTGTAALTIDIPCTIINEGKIIGKGGGAVYRAAGLAGGRAINITSSGVTFTNASGAYIGGGGGGGGSANGDPYRMGAGGGAGGGVGGIAGTNSGIRVAGGAGGALNATGSTGVSDGSQSAGGGGGGRILPGVGGSYGTGTCTAGLGGGSGGGGGTDYNNTFQRGGSGGSAGAVGGNAGNSGFAQVGSAGGGGWGAAGGRSFDANGGFLGGAGGAAIVPNGNAYTLSNSGTIYGST